jgi:membrane protein DedA with SNARE-associated domain
MSNSEDQRKVNSYLKYSGLALQMAFVIMAGYYLGQKLDQWLAFKKPVMTLLSILVLFSAFMYKLYIEISKDR